MKEVLDSNSSNTERQYRNTGQPTGAVGKIPKSMKIFIYGIVAICTSVFLVGFVYAVIALVWEKKAMKILESNYGLYRYEKWKLLVGKGLAWGAMGLAFFYWAYFAIFFAISFR
jgi:hypothetical protein